MQCGAIKLTWINACFEGADPIDRWAVDSSEGQVVGKRAVGAGRMNLYQHDYSGGPQ